MMMIDSILLIFKVLLIKEENDAALVCMCVCARVRVYVIVGVPVDS